MKIMSHRITVLHMMNVKYLVQCLVMILLEQSKLNELLLHLSLEVRHWKPLGCNLLMAQLDIHLFLSFVGWGQSSFYSRMSLALLLTYGFPGLYTKCLLVFKEVFLLWLLVTRLQMLCELWRLFRVHLFFQQQFFSKQFFWPLGISLSAYAI